jgi:ribonuclease VapC
MVLDTSALVAVLQTEPEADALTETMLAAASPRISAATLVEAGLVMQGRHGDVGARDLDALLVQVRAEVVPVTAAHAGLAREAFRRFGKGRHPAGLNYGDCFSYALAVALAEPLLFVGDDFGRTDVDAAPY